MITAVTFMKKIMRATKIASGLASLLVFVNAAQAPEQFDGGAISGQVDIYALGATLYEFLTGERAYPQLDVTALLMAKTKMDVKPLPDHVPKNLAGIITKAMANATGERYATAQSMGYDLENALRSTPAAAGYGILEGLVKRFNNNL